MSPASAPMVTRCPKCGTAFRITSAQLQSARGAVRCGSCLQVFKAQEHLVDTAKPKAPATAPAKATASPQTPTTPSQPTPQAPEPKASTSKPAASATKETAVKAKPATPAQQTSLAFNKPSEDEDLLISDDMDEPSAPEASKYDFDGFLDIDVPPPASSSLFERTQSAPDKDEDIDKNVDESWAEQLIDDEEEQDTQAAAPSPAIPDFDPDEVPSDFDAPAPAPAANTQGLVFSLIDSPEEQSEHQQTDKTPDASIFAESEQEEPKRQVKTEPKIRAYDNSRSTLLMNIIPAPVEFTAKRIRKWQHRLWPTLSLIALVALLVQIAWFKFDYLSRIEPYRSAYQQLCPWLGCQLPTLIDTHSIKAYNLVVRSHPDKANALMVDAIILNTAPFDQPFPDLVLAFSDLDGKPLAARRFTPKEYLGGELAGKELMPKNQPIQLSLDLVDPGADAVNYHVYIP